MSKSTVLRLTSDITDASADALVKQIESAAGQPITLRIASPGGSIMAGTRILSAMREHGQVATICESLAASMASAVFCLGGTRTMAKGSRLMVHKPWTSSSGESADLRKSADLLDSLEKDLLSIYATASGLPEAQLQAMLASETWMTAQESKELGFATAIAGEKAEIPAAYYASFVNVPADLLEEQPEASSVVPNTMAGLRASVKQLSSELLARTEERNDARAALARTKFLMSALERSYGIGAAAEFLSVPAGGEGGPDVLARFESLSGEAQTAFYLKNKDAIHAAQNARQYRA